MAIAIKKTHKAFTIIEALLVVSLFAVLSIAVYNAFASGLKIWDRGTRFFAEEDIFIFLEKVEQDLRNSFVHSQMMAQGDKTAMEFAATMVLVWNYPDRSEAVYVRQIGKIRYFYDPQTRSIYRQAAGYGGALKNRFLPKQKLANKVTSLRFEYFYLTSKGLVQDAKFQDALPARVVIQIDYESGQEVRRVIKVVDLPLG